MNQSDLGQRIRRARERIGMSQEKFAEAIERDQKAISEYETGKRKIAAIELPHIALVLGVPISYFFEGEFQTDELDQVLLQEFHTLPTPEDKKTALQAIRLIADAIKRHSSTEK